MKIFVLMTLLVGLVACNGGKDPASVKLKTDEDKTFYAMGYMLGGNLQRLDLKDPELQALFKGVSHAASKTKSEVDMTVFQPKIQEMFKSRMTQISKKEKESGNKFIDDYLKKNKLNNSQGIEDIEDMPLLYHSANIA